MKLSLYLVLIKMPESLNWNWRYADLKAKLFSFESIDIISESLWSQ